MNEIYSELPEWLQVLILAEALVFNIAIIAGLSVMVWLKVEIWRFYHLTESEQGRQHDLIRQINKKLRHND